MEAGVCGQGTAWGEGGRHVACVTARDRKLDRYV